MTTRRLAAMLAADVVGFSSMMEKDEEGTASHVRAMRREVIEPKLSAHHGRLVKTTGDGFLAEFASPVEAVRCALSVQDSIAERGEANGGLKLRIGINLGDIIIEDDGDVFGDGVNVATRLEQMADPGGVLVSGKIYVEIEGKIDRPFESRGEQQVKNLARPVRVYALVGATLPKAEPKALMLPDKPSIAVLPFTNMSGDPEQEYFADGVVEDIITALSRFKWLFVIARNSSFTYKGRPVDLKQVGRELGVRYVLEGSVRKSGNRIRITGQLIDALSGHHIWAERFDRELTAIFELQDEITQRVVAATEPNVRSMEIERSSRKRTDSLDAYDLYLRALPEMYRFTEEGYLLADTFLSRATDIDPNFSEAWAALADCICRLSNMRWWTDLDLATPRACDAVRRAISADPSNGIALATGAWAFAIMAGEHEQALDFANQAVQFNPNSSLVHSRCGWALVHCDEQQRALESFDAALRLSPLDPERYIPLAGKGIALLFMRQFDEAADWGRRADQLRPNHPISLRLLAATLGLAGRLPEAQEAIRRLKLANLNATMATAIGNAKRFRYRWMLDLYAEGLRRAGLPE